MTSELDLAQQLFEAQKDRRHDVDAAPYAALDRAAAYRVQTRVLDMLGAKVGLLKTGIHPDGVGIVAPIFADHVGTGDAVQMPSTTVTGLEVEIGLVLGRDLPDGGAYADDASVADAIDHYFLGVEVCGTRYADRSLAGLNGGLADSVSAFGYVRQAAPWTHGTEIDGLGDITISFAGAQIYAAPPRHGFGSVLASLLAYARQQHPSYPLKAGTVITTGSMCGLVPTSGAGHVVASFGGQSVSLDLV